MSPHWAETWPCIRIQELWNSGIGRISKLKVFRYWVIFSCENIVTGKSWLCIGWFSEARLLMWSRPWSIRTDLKLVLVITCCSGWREKKKSVFSHEDTNFFFFFFFITGNHCYHPSSLKFQIIVWPFFPPCWEIQWERDKILFTR